MDKKLPEGSDSLGLRQGFVSEGSTRWAQVLCIITCSAILLIPSVLTKEAIGTQWKTLAETLV